MQVLLLGIFVALYLHDATTTVEVFRNGEFVGFAEALPGDVWPSMSRWQVLLIVVLPKAVFGLFYWFVCRRTRRKLGTPRGQRSLNLLEAINSTLPILLLTLFMLDLWIGALREVRVHLQHVVLIDELLVMLPTLLVSVSAWAAYYPVDRRLREAAIFRHADEGKPIYPLLTRAGYITMQLRHQFGLLLLPLLAVYGWHEAVNLLGPNFNGPFSQQTTHLLTPVGVLIVFVGAPLVIRYVWQTTPLPPGDVRDRMLKLCDQHSVRVRELLLWRTSGRMINAAVTGLVRQVRFILLSDGLLDQLRPREVEAVMAHELAHVKCKHLIWMGLSIIALLGTAELLFNRIYEGIHGALAWEQLAMQHDVKLAGINLSDPQNQMLIVSLPTFAIALLAFGWVSRRVERQADVFAVKHLAMTGDDPQYDALGKQVFDEIAVQTMVDALQRVAELNHAPTTAKNWRQGLAHWRHGTIAWRQAHLRSLVGKPIDHTAVDRAMMRVKIATLVCCTLMAVLYFR